MSGSTQGERNESRPAPNALARPTDTPSPHLSGHAGRGPRPKPRAPSVLRGHLGAIARSTDRAEDRLDIDDRRIVGDLGRAGGNVGVYARDALELTDVHLDEHGAGMAVHPRGGDGHLCGISHDSAPSRMSPVAGRADRFGSKIP